MLSTHLQFKEQCWSQASGAQNPICQRWGRAPQREARGFAPCLAVQVAYTQICSAQSWGGHQTSDCPGWLDCCSQLLSLHVWSPDSQSSVSCLITFNKFLFCLSQLESENASWVLVKELIIYLTIRKIWSSKKQKCICHSFWILAVYVKLLSLTGPLKTFVQKCW